MTQVISLLMSPIDSKIVIAGHYETDHHFDTDANFYNKSQAPARYVTMYQYLMNHGVEELGFFDQKIAEMYCDDSVMYLWDDLQKRLSGNMSHNDILWRYKHKDFMQLSEVFASVLNLYWYDSICSDVYFEHIGSSPIIFAYPSDSNSWKTIGDATTDGARRLLISCLGIYWEYPSDVTERFFKALGWDDVKIFEYDGVLV